MFWNHFHPGIQAPKNLRDTALYYCEILTRKNVPYEKFDNICSSLEEEQEKIDLNFNIVAYVLDWIRLEYQQKMEQQESARYINLPKQRTPLGQIDIQKLEPAIKTLEKNCPALGIRELLERINTLRAQGKHKENRSAASGAPF